MKSDERLTARIEHWPGHRDAADRIGPVKNDESLAMLRAGPHCLAHRGDIGVKPGPDVLDVKHERVDSLQHGGSRPPRLAVEAEHLEAGRLILRVADS